MDVQVDFLGILVAGVVSMAIGFLWYSPVLFAKPWVRLMGYTKDSLAAAQKKMGPMYGLSFVLSLLTAYVLTHVMALSQTFYQHDTLLAGIGSAFWMWIGFVMPVQATDVIFGGKKWELFAINTGYQLTSMLAMGVVLGLM